MDSVAGYIKKKLAGFSPQMFILRTEIKLVARRMLNGGLFLDFRLTKHNRSSRRGQKGIKGWGWFLSSPHCRFMQGQRCTHRKWLHQWGNVWPCNVNKIWWPGAMGGEITAGEVKWLVKLLSTLRRHDWGNHQWPDDAIKEFSKTFTIRWWFWFVLQNGWTAHQCCLQPPPKKKKKKANKQTKKTPVLYNCNDYLLFWWNN